MNIIYIYIYTVYIQLRLPSRHTTRNGLFASLGYRSAQVQVLGTTGEVETFSNLLWQIYAVYLNSQADLACSLSSNCSSCYCTTACNGRQSI